MSRADNDAAMIAEAREAGSREATDYIVALLIEARDDGAYDGARFSLGRKRRPDPNTNVLTDLFYLRCMVYDQSFYLAKAAALKEGATE